MSATLHNAKLSCCLILSAAILLIAAPAPAAWFVKIDGVEGSSVDSDHKKWINLESLNHGASAPTDLTSLDLSEVTFTKRVDASSPALAQAAASGETFDVIDLDFLEVDPATGTPTVYLKYKLERCFVKSWSTSGSTDPDPIETVTLSLPSAGNLVQEFYDPVSGRRTDRVVHSFRTDPVTDEFDFGFVDPAVTLPGGVSLQPKGTPHVEVGDLNGDGLDDMALTRLSSSGVDGYNANNVAHEMGHNFDMRHKDPNNRAHVEGEVTVDGGETFSFGVEREMKESGEKSARLSADFENIGSSAYDFIVSNGGTVVATGSASTLDEGIFLSGTGDPTDLLDESAAVSLSYGEIEWTLTGMDKLGHGGAIFVLNPSLATTVTLEAVDPFPSSGLLTNTSFGFGNFESVVVTGVTAVPEPAAGVLVALGLAGFVGRRRRR